MWEMSVWLSVSAGSSFIGLNSKVKLLLLIITNPRRRNGEPTRLVRYKTGAELCGSSSCTTRTSNLLIHFNFNAWASFVAF